MTEATEQLRVSDPRDWYTDYKEEHSQQLYKERPKRVPPLTLRAMEAGGASRHDAHYASLLRAVRTIFERQDLAKQAEAVIKDLKIPLDEFVYLALVEFIAKRGEVLEGHTAASATADSYWEISEYTKEEFNAFLEADRLTPELAERYKDLLED